MVVVGGSSGNEGGSIFMGDGISRGSGNNTIFLEIVEAGPCAMGVLP